MKSISIKRIVAMLMVLCLLFAFTGCKKSSKTDGSGSEYEYEYVYEYEEDEDAESKITVSAGDKKPVSSDLTVSNDQVEVDAAKITLGISTQERAEFANIIPVFEKKYPEVKVEVQELAATLYAITSKWTSLAAANKLPDVVIGSENFGYIMQQGWAYPLDNLVAADKNKDDVLEMGLDRYRYEGKLYALPFRLQFNTMAVNDDLLETLNLPKPGYDWTISKFEELANKATTTEYSGLNYMYNSSEPTYGFDAKIMSAYLPDGYEQFGYNIKEGRFSLQANNAWVNSHAICERLKAVPGLVSDHLKDYSLRNNGQTDDYDKKFGKNADAFVSGKVLFGNHNTWQFDWFVNTLTYDCDLYPMPTADGIAQRIQTHVDFVFMNSNCDQSNYKAAFALCRFLSYDTDGCIARIDYSANKSQAEQGQLIFYGPASESQQVLNAFKAEEIYPDGLKYILNKIITDPAHTLVADCNKVVPDFWSNVDQYREDADAKISKGTAEPSALVVDLENKINAAMKTTLSYLSKKVKANQDKFYAAHPYEAR